MTATVTPLRPRLDSLGRTRSGGHMSQVLDVIERLLTAAAHPDIVTVERYGPDLGPWGPTVEQSKVTTISGVRVVHRSTATASLWEAVWPGEKPVPAPDVLPAPRQNRAPRLAVLAARLLDVAKPDGFTAWRLVALPNLGLVDKQAGLPFGLSIVTADRSQHLLRASATGPTVGEDPDVEPFPDYVIPEEVKTCLIGSSTPKTSPCPPAGAVPAGRS